MTMVVDQEYWDDSYSGYRFARVPESDPTRQLVHQWLPPAAPRQKALEFGCFPGRYLFEVASLGYEVSGCDRTPRIEQDLPKWLNSNGLRVGSFHRCDYREMPKDQFDIVASFGFVEHFTDFEAVFDHHFDYAKPGGLVLVQFPNFRGAVQHALRSLFDRDNLENHFIPAMNLAAYRSRARRHGEVLRCAHYGGFDFWTDHFRGSPGPRRRKLLSAFNRTRSLWSKLPTAAPWSPYAAILVRKAL